MRNKEILKLVAGFKRFRDKYFTGDDALFNRLSTGQNPKTLIIGCSDSRVDPALISSASPGELFVIRNVANLVPPFETGKTGLHGVSAAIEFAVVDLKVENVVILGHRQCGGIRALMSDVPLREGSFIGGWVKIAHNAKQRVLKNHAKSDFEIQCRECEKEAIITSLENLRTFPFINEAIQNRGLNLFGIYFDLEQGQLFEFDPSQNGFTQIELGS